MYIFDGEEFAKYARLWTRGYDVYTPNRVLVAHDYSGQLLQGAPVVIPEGADPTDWVRNGMKDTYRWESFDASMHRIRTLLGMEGGGESSASCCYYY